MNIHEFRLQVTGQILRANSEIEVNEVIDNAVSCMTRKNVNGYIILRLLDRTNDEMEKTLEESCNEGKRRCIRQALDRIREIRTRLMGAAAH